MDRKLNKLYENMYTPSVDENIVEESKTFSKFDLNDYTDIIYEGKSGHGDSKIVKKALKQAVNDGLVTVQDTKSGWIVKSVHHPEMMETIHTGERAFHYLRRFLQKL